MLAGILVSFAIGLLTGLLIDYPKIDNSMLSGTVGKVKNYRNVKPTEKDITLRNDLLEDTLKLAAVNNYISFYYVRTVNLNEKLSYAIESVQLSEEFREFAAAELGHLNSFNLFLSNARKELLTALASLGSIKDVHPSLLSNSLNQAYNIISRVNFNKNLIIDFAEKTDLFLQENQVSQSEKLIEIKDMLLYNEVVTSIATKDKIMIKYFDKQGVIGKGFSNTQNVNINENLKRDIESLGILIPDNEKLGLLNIERLGAIYLSSPDKLGIYLDSENLGGIIFTDSEKLGAGFSDSEKLGGIIFTDMQKLNLKMY